MIHKATFQNFKALRDVTVTFDRRLTVLVGPNGCGKSSVLQGIRLIGHVVHDGEIRFNSDAAGGVDFIGRDVFAAQPTVVLEHHADDGWIYSAGLRPKLAPEDDPTNGAFGELLPVYNRSTKERRGTPTSMPSGPHRDNFGQSVYVELTRRALATPSFPDTIPPTIGPDGERLASCLAYFQRKEPEQLNAILEATKLVIPNIVRFRFDYQAPSLMVGTGTGGGFPDVLLVDFIGAKGVPADSVSEGTLYVLGLMTIIFGPQRPRVLLFDDIDRGLHPKAQMRLVGLLRKLLDQNPMLQIIATSHSPYILDRLDPEQVRVMQLDDTGGAIIAELGDHPLFEKWKNDMSPGEFWSHMGDEWVRKRKGIPAAAEVA